MASPNLDSLFPLLLPDLPECPLPTVRSSILRAARRFCRESTAWRLTLDPIAYVLATNDYPLVTPANSETAMIINVDRTNGFGELTGKSIEQMAQILPDWKTAQGAPRYFNSQNNTALSIYPAPSAADLPNSVTPRIAAMPTRTAADLAVELVNRFEEALVAGTLAILYNTSRETPWTAGLRPDAVQTQEARFVKYITDARIAADLHGNVRSSTRAKPREFGA